MFGSKSSSRVKSSFISIGLRAMFILRAQWTSYWTKNFIANENAPNIISKEHFRITDLIVLFTDFAMEPTVYDEIDHLTYAIIQDNSKRKTELLVPTINCFITTDVSDEPNSNSIASSERTERTITTGTTQYSFRFQFFLWIQIFKRNQPEKSA